VTARLIPLTPALSVHVDPRRCDFDRLTDVDLELGRRVRDVLVAENLVAFLPDPSPEAAVAARTCGGSSLRVELPMLGGWLRFGLPGPRAASTATLSGGGPSDHRPQRPPAAGGAPAAG
jgi:hypothetical protein